MPDNKTIRNDFGFKCYYFKTNRKFMWEGANGICITCSANDGINLHANNVRIDYSLSSIRSLFLLVESIHRQLVLDVEIMNGLWFNNEFWPLGWIENGKP